MVKLLNFYSSIFESLYKVYKKTTQLGWFRISKIIWVYCKINFLVIVPISDWSLIKYKPF